MNTPMIGFRLDPQLTEMMDQRCKDLNISRAEFLRGLIVGELGSPVIEGEKDSTDVQLAIATLRQSVSDLDSRVDLMGDDFQAWVSRKLSDLEKRVGDRLGQVELRLGQRR